jgi:hypothetical protein
MPFEQFLQATLGKIFVAARYFLAAFRLTRPVVAVPFVLSYDTDWGKHVKRAGVRIAPWFAPGRRQHATFLGHPQVFGARSRAQPGALG